MFTRGFKSWGENVSLQQRHALRLQATDPLDPWLLADHMGVKVWTVQQIPGLDSGYVKILLHEDPESWSAVTICVETIDVVILNSAHSVRRQASDLTHELSHLLIGHKPARIDVSEEGLMLNTYDKKQEEEANWLAGCLLLPRNALLFIQRQGMASDIVETTYRVSQEMLRYRLNVTGVDSQLRRVREKKLQ